MSVSAEQKANLRDLVQLKPVRLKPKRWVESVWVEITDHRINRVLHKNKHEAGITDTDVVLYKDDQQKQLGTVSKTRLENGDPVDNSFDIKLSPFALSTGLQGIDIVITHEMAHIVGGHMDFLNPDIPKTVREHLKNIAEAEAEAVTLLKILMKHSTSQ